MIRPGAGRGSAWPVTLDGSTMSRDRTGPEIGGMVMANFHVYAAGTSSNVQHPTIRRIGISDVFDALHRGIEDFWDKPSHYVFLCLIYPIVGGFLITWTSGGNALQLIYPLMTGFALLGPFAAIGLYEISRRREQGLDTSGDMPSTSGNRQPCRLLLHSVSC
jgi:uncharacterized membrane protein